MTTMAGYIRVSTEAQVASGLGMDAQREKIQHYADSKGWDILWFVDEGRSAKSMDRPALQAALAQLHPKHRVVQGIVVARLDRLSRSVHDFSGILQTAAARKWAVIALDLGIDTSTPTGKLVANVVVSVAEFERELIGERTSAAMQIAKSRGQRFGFPSALPQTTGDRLLVLRRTLTLAAAAEALNAEGHTTATGAPWSVNTVAKGQKRHESIGYAKRTEWLSPKPITDIPGLPQRSFRLE